MNPTAESALLTDLYQLSMVQAYLDSGMTDIAVFELLPIDTTVSVGVVSLSTSLSVGFPGVSNIDSPCRRERMTSVTRSRG